MFSKWFTLNTLCLNDSKTHFIGFGLSHDDDANANISNFDNYIVESVKQVRYLGFVIAKCLF